MFQGLIHSDVPIIGSPYSNTVPHTVEPRQPNDINDKYWDLHPTVAALLRRPRIPSGTEQWKAERVNLFTGTNAASITLEPKMRSSFQPGRKALLRAKTAPASKKHSSSACDYGIEQEEHAARVFSQVTGLELVEEDIGLLRHRTHSFIGVTPDRVLKHLPVILEIKCPYVAHIKHQPPPYYMPQVQLQLEVCEMDVCFFVQYRPTTLITPGIIDITVVERDPEWFPKWLPEFRAFWDEVLAARLSLQSNPNATKAILDGLVDQEQKEISAVLEQRRAEEAAAPKPDAVVPNVAFCFPVAPPVLWQRSAHDIADVSEIQEMTDDEVSYVTNDTDDSGDGMEWLG